MAYVSFGSMVMNIILNFILMKYYGIFGIAICTILIQITKYLVFLKYVKKQKRIMVN